MDSLPALVNSDQMISLDMPSTVSKDDNISMMSNDSCPLAVVMGDLPPADGLDGLHSADALEGLHSADAAAVADIITSGLKDVDCSKVDAADVTSLELEHLSINDEEFYQMVGERQGQTTSLNSLTMEENYLKSEIGEGAHVKRDQDRISGIYASELLKENNVKICENENRKVVESKNKSSVVCVGGDEKIVLLNKDKEGRGVKVPIDVDQDLDAITEIISAPSSDAVNKNKSKPCGDASKTEIDHIVKNNQPDDNLIKSPPVSKEREDDSEGAVVDGWSHQLENHSKTAMHVLDFDENSNGEYEANSPGSSSSCDGEMGLRDRGGSNRNKRNKFSSSSCAPLRPILPKTAISATSSTGIATTGLLEQTPSMSSQLEASIPSVVQEAMVQGITSPGIVTDGIPSGQYSQHEPINNQHSPHTLMMMPVHGMATSLHAGQQQFIAVGQNRMATNAQPKRQLYQQLQQHQCLSPPQQTGLTTAHPTLAMGQPYIGTIGSGENLPTNVLYQGQTNNSTIDSRTLNLIEGKHDLERAQNEQRPQIPVSVSALPQLLMMNHHTQQQHQQYQQPQLPCVPIVSAGYVTTQRDVLAAPKQTLDFIEYAATSQQLNKCSVKSNRHKTPKRLGGNVPQQSPTTDRITPGTNKLAMKCANNNIGASTRLAKLSTNQTELPHINSNLPHSTPAEGVVHENTAHSNETMEDILLNQERILLNFNPSHGQTIDDNNDSMDEKLIEGLQENFLSEEERKQLLSSQNVATINYPPVSTTDFGCLPSNVGHEIRGQPFRQTTPNIQSLLLLKGQNASTHGLSHQTSQVRASREECPAPLFASAQSDTDKEPLGLDYIQMPDDIDFSLSQYLNSGEKTSSGSGGRINSESFEKYLNSNKDNVKDENHAVGSQRKIIGKHITKGNRTRVSGSGACQLPTEVASIDVNAWRDGAMNHVYGGSNTGGVCINRYQAVRDGGNQITGNVGVGVSTERNMSNLQNIGTSQNDSQQLLNLMNNLSQQELELGRHSINPCHPGTNLCFSSKLAVTGSTNPSNVLHKSNFGLGSPITNTSAPISNALSPPSIITGGADMQQSIYSSRISDQSMPSVENCLNNLSRSDSNVNSSGSREMVYNNSLNIVANTDPNYDNIACLPHHGSSKNLNTIGSQNAPSPSKRQPHSKKSPSSSSSSSSQKSKKRFGQSMASVQEWVFNSTDGHSTVPASGGSLLPDDAQGIVSSIPPRQDYHQQQHIFNDQRQLPQQPQMSHSHRQHQSLHHPLNEFNQQMVASPAACLVSPQQNATAMLAMGLQPAGHNLSQEHHLYQLQQQQQPPFQQHNNYNPQRINNPTLDHYNKSLASSGNVVPNHLSHHQQPSSSSSPLPSPLTYSSPSPSPQNPQHIRQRHNLQSRGSSPQSIKSPKPQHTQDKAAPMTTTTSSPRSTSQLSSSYKNVTTLTTTAGISSTTTNPLIQNQMSTTFTTATILNPHRHTTTNVQAHAHNKHVKSTLSSSSVKSTARTSAILSSSTSPSGQQSSLGGPVESHSQSQMSMSSVEFLESEPSSMSSSMQSNSRWLESLEVDSENETALHYLWNMEKDQDKYQQLRDQRNFENVVDQLNHQQQTALYVSVVKEKAYVVQFLVDNNADVNIICKSEHKGLARGDVAFQTALHEAVERGNVEIAQILLNYDTAEVDPKRQGSNQTPLMLALSCHSLPDHDNLKMIQMLRQHASLHTQDIEGKTPLMYMVMTGDVRLVKKTLEDVGVQEARNLVTAATKKKLMTCLHYAAALKERKVGSERKIEIIKLLIVHGADPDKVNADRQSPRHWASNEIRMAMNQLQTRTVTDGGATSSASTNNSPRNSPRNE